MTRNSAGSGPGRALTRGFARHAVSALLLGVLVAVCYRFADQPAAIWARGLDPGIVRIFRVVTALGSSGPYLISLALLYPLLRYVLGRALAAQQALFVFVAIGLSGLVVDLIKLLAGRWRPIALFAEPPHYGFEYLIYGYRHNSFPSGHTTTTWALAYALTLLYPQLRLLWYCAAALIGVSRVIVGQHYPGDVLAGAWLGVVVALAVSRSGRFRDVVAARAVPPRDV